MTFTGNSVKSIRKQDLINSKVPSIGFKKTVFAHQASAGETGINLYALKKPSTSYMPVFNQPLVAELVNANLYTFAKNLTLTSSVRGPLIQGMSYTVNSNSYISFTASFGTALANEIFVGVIDPVARTGNLMADAEVIVASGTLAPGSTDISVGKSFKTNMYPTTNIGAVMLILAGVVQSRNSGNASVGGDGNYYELDNGFGECALLKLNSAVGISTKYIVISTATTVIRPDGSLMDEIEKQQGTIDAMIPTLAALAGVSVTNFYATPTQPQLKQFGDRFLSLGERVYANAGSSIALVVNSYQNLCSLILNPGVWDVSGNTALSLTALGAMSTIESSISTSSGAVDSKNNGGYSQFAPNWSGLVSLYSSVCVRRIVVSVGSTQPIYLIGRINSISGGAGNWLTDSLITATRVGIQNI